MAVLVSTFFDSSSDFAKGFALFSAIKKELADNKPVELDFTGTSGLSTSFLHGILGEAFVLKGMEDAKRLLVLRNLSRAQAGAITKYAHDYKLLQDIE